MSVLPSGPTRSPPDTFVCRVLITIAVVAQVAATRSAAKASLGFNATRTEAVSSRALPTPIAHFTTHPQYTILPRCLISSVSSFTDVSSDVKPRLGALLELIFVADLVEIGCIEGELALWRGSGSEKDKKILVLKQCQPTFILRLASRLQ